MEGENQVTTETGDQGQQQQQTGAESLGWRAALPDDLKEHEYVKTFQKPGDFVKDALTVKTERDALNEKLGKAIFKPDANATDEQKAAYREAMGIPSKAEDYEIPVPEGESTELADGFRAFAFEKGLPKDHVKETTEFWNAYVAKQKENYAKELKTQTEAIKTKWGNDYEKNSEVVKSMFQAIKDVGINEFATVQAMGPDGKPMLLGNHPAVIQFFYEFGKKILPDSGVQGAGPAQPQTTGFSYPNSPAPPKDGG